MEKTLVTRKRLYVCGLVIAGFVVTWSLLLTVAFAQSLGVKKAREVIQNMAGANLKSNQVQIRNISPGIGSGGVVVEAQIETAFRMVKGDNDWEIIEVRLGDRQWESLELLEEAVRREKERRTTTMLKQYVDGLKAFRNDRGVYVSTDDIAELIDHISPKYIPVPNRFDLWGKQFEYEGRADGYRLFSRGADGRKGTKDDLVFEN